MTADQLRQDRDLTAGDLHAGQLGAGLQPARDRRERLLVGPLDGEVVHDRERLRPDADHVVDVHRDAVDPDGVVAAGPLGDDQLGADAVGADRDAQVRRDLQHRRVVPGQRDGARGAPGVDRAQDADERADRPVGGARVHAGARVGVRHRSRFWRTARMAAARPARQAAHGHSGARRSIPIEPAVASVDRNADPRADPEGDCPLACARDNPPRLQPARPQQHRQRDLP